MKYEVGMYLLLKKKVEHWHYVKVAKIILVNTDTIILDTIQFTGDGSCPITFKADKSFSCEKSNVDKSWYVFNTKAELLAKMI